MDGLTMVFSANESFAAFNGIEISYNSTPLYKQAIVATGTMNGIVSFSGAGTVTGNVLSSSVAVTMTAEGTINQTDISGAITALFTFAGTGS